MYERLETRHASNKAVSGQDNQQRQGHSYSVVQLLAKTSIRLCQRKIPIIKKNFYNEFCILKAFLFKTNLPALMIKVIMLIN